MKNRTETESRILDAVTAIVLEEGMTGVGVNSIAVKADCSKVLIYRYFGGLDGLLSRWAEGNNYWIRQVGRQNLAALSGATLELKEKITADVFKGQLKDMRSERVMRELIRWQLSEDNPVCRAMMARAEEKGLGLTTALLENTETNLDVEAITALVVSGIFYLTLSSDHAPVFNGVRLDAEEGWERIEGAIEQIADMMFSRIQEKKK
ncbi:MAG: TetR/AcrR family transcriptional regulator [Spirochaetales bacterium]|nr:TetR/AcrR family transcriptional regulator [Spirochaetales bacterium]